MGPNPGYLTLEKNQTGITSSCQQWENYAFQPGMIINQDFLRL